MPRSVNVRKYPSEYFEIVEAVAERGETLEVGVGSRREAQQYQGHWGAFIAALKIAANKHQEYLRKKAKEIDPKLLMLLEDPDGDYYVKMHEIAQKVQPWFDDLNMVMKYRPRSETPQALHLRAALKNSKGVVQTGDDDPLARFLAKHGNLVQSD